MTETKARLTGVQIATYWLLTLVGWAILGGGVVALTGMSVDVASTPYINSAIRLGGATFLAGWAVLFVLLGIGATHWLWGEMADEERVENAKKESNAHVGQPHLNAL